MRNLRILVVEDEFLIASMLQRMLGRGGCDVSWVGSIEEAEEAIGQHAFHGAFLDVSLSHGQVFPFCETLEKRKIPFVFATAYDKAVLPEQYRDRLYISKPIERSQVELALAYFRGGRPSKDA